MEQTQGADYITPEEYAERAGVDLRQVWRRLEQGDLVALAACEWGDNQFDYWRINAEAVRAVAAGLDVEFDPGYGGVRHIRGGKSVVRILIDPTLTPELFSTAASAVPTPSKATSVWKVMARNIAEEWVNKQEKDTGSIPSVTEIASHVEGELSSRGITGTRGKFLDAETIKREVLVGITGRPRGYNLTARKAKK
jgi:hypothetical protein